MRAVAVVGNPKPASRTADAAERLARALGATDVDVIDLVELGGKLIGWGDADVAAAVARVQSADVAVFASPTYKATYTGLLKLFLDQLPTATGLAGVVAVPLMLGAGPAHALAPELLLKPVLIEVGATVPAPAVYQLDSAYVDDPKLAEWVERWSPVIRAVVAAK